ncbi:hypothetical protein FSARC_12049 [Fusarium sarcochroum]|uniref:Heterokaryon incompatibility domain-containing protein n=1 Tax=Fusarium sarcochroum TaxID=1208366 RepID=A0A8H4TB07_9HYPO|nr:hypothetical protein FSARC_12049 [Fusarium sarcochroum]
MRLLNVSSLILQEFNGRHIPPYAILSHTWGEGEVLFSDIGTPTVTSKQGYPKVAGCCEKAAEDGFEWVWIDTCCIDKSSSSELSEAINSMYKWYQRATVCYAYLQDVTIESQTSEAFHITDFCKSRWFTRGWTLQELIAPQIVELCSKEWTIIGTKRSLASSLESVTGIPISVLRGANPFIHNVAERMSWASARVTTREEDLAYCLLGLFHVNMPLLYGEGPKSFLRLQEQILRQEEDYSIFAWTLQQEIDPSNRYMQRMYATGFLAWSPSQFCKTTPKKSSPPFRIRRQDLLTGVTSAELLEEQASPSVSSQDEKGHELVYRLLYEKDYSHMFRSFDSIFAMKVAPSPPELTSRGLRISLPIMRPKDPALPTIAWIFYEIQDCLVCVFLEPDRERSTNVHCRASPTWLIGVHKSLLSHFIPTELFIHPGGYFRNNNIFNTTPPTSALFSSKRIQVLVEAQSTETHAVDVVLAYPSDEWMKLETHIREYSFKALWVRCSHGSQSSLFRIDFMISSDTASCAVRELPDSQSSNEIDETRKKSLFRACMQYKKSFLAHTDRAVRRSARIPETVLSAALHKRPSSDEDLLIYRLHVETWDVAESPIWVQLSLLQENKEVDGTEVEDVKSP